MIDQSVCLAEIVANEIEDFKKDLQEAFAIAVVEEGGELQDGPIPSDEDLDRAIHAPGAVALHILCNGKKVGGAVVSINEETHRNTLDLLFLKVGQHGRGLGHKAWRAIEARYPQTITWQTYTPYFERRNIHFYINKCGFRIIAFYNAHHPDPNHPAPGDLPADEGFLFEKAMR